jgi:protein TonB
VANRAPLAAAWGVSLAVHALVLAALVSIEPTHIEVPTNDEPLIYVEPAPPPPLGGPNAGAASSELAPPVTSPAPTAIEQPAPKPVEKKPPVKKPPAKPKAPAPVPEPAAPSAAGTSAAAAGVSASEGGKVGGTAGGLEGGTLGAHGDQVVSAAQAAEPPIVVSRVMPAYPALARTRGIQGQVVLRATVDRDGRVEPGVKVVQSVPLLDDAAIDAFRRWRFRAGRDREGRPVRVVVEVPVRFELR